MELQRLIEVISSTLGVIDQEKPVGSKGRFKPGIGPLTETEVTALLVEHLTSDQRGEFEGCGSRQYPGSSTRCDLVINGYWAIEIKLARPFGDNGQPAERWSENLLYPYPGNTSAIGDALKLIGSRFSERKAVIIFGYEHDPPEIPLDPAIRGFELLSKEIVGINLGARVQMIVNGLVHPYHRRLTVCGWEVLGRSIGAA